MKAVVPHRSLWERARAFVVDGFAEHSSIHRRMVLFQHANRRLFEKVNEAHDKLYSRVSEADASLQKLSNNHAVLAERLNRKIMTDKAHLDFIDAAITDLRKAVNNRGEQR